MTSYKHRYPPERIAMWVVIGIIAMILLFFLLGGLVQLLWNQALVPATGLTVISFWQAVGLFILAKLFFGFGSGTSGGNKSWKRKRKHRSSDDRNDSGQAPDIDDDVKDTAFRDYWQREGKAAYQDWIARRDTTGDD